MIAGVLESAEVPIGRWGRVVGGPSDDIGLLLLIETSENLEWRQAAIGFAKPPFRVTRRTGRGDTYEWLVGRSVEEMVGVPGRVTGRYVVQWTIP
jgi:hypothetical protein